LVPFMKGDQAMMRPLMTNPEQVIYLGNEQYAKAATGLYMLRHTIMGPELFDRAFKDYAERWAFKHPKIADFFRTMEDASAVDLDWFWRGWFYTTDRVDISLEQVRWLKHRETSKDPEKRVTVAQERAGGKNTYTNFDGGPEPFSVVETPSQFYGEFRNRVDDKAIAQNLQGKNLYEVKLSNQ